MKTTIMSLVLVLVLNISAIAAEEKRLPDVPADLATEIHKLRISIENLGAANYKALMVFERIKVQNDQILLVRNMVDKITDDISNIEMSRAHAAEQLNNSQGRSELIRDESTQLSMKEELANLKKQIEYQDKQLLSKKDKLMLLENELNDLLRKNTELISRLDSIDIYMK